VWEKKSLGKISTPRFLIAYQYQGCQIFLDTMYQNGQKHSKLPQNCQMTIKYAK
jgi:hypothetical protein